MSRFVHAKRREWRFGMVYLTRINAQHDSLVFPRKTGNHCLPQRPCGYRQRAAMILARCSAALALFGDVRDVSPILVVSNGAPAFCACLPMPLGAPLLVSGFQKR